MNYIFGIILSYLLGSIPFGYLVGKYLKNVDIRERGSGNIGTANAFRVMGAKYAILVLIGDCLKGFLAVFLARRLLIIDNISFYLIIGLFAIIGHNWSIFLKFKGGKGIATTYGVVFSFYPIISLISALIWGIIVITIKIASLGSIISVLSMLILSFIFNTTLEFKYFLIIINLLALFRHRSNIIRLIQHKENKLK
ncbi:MAG: glycerol-3-phosphate 1-O-acyltransferase PlsY [Atribacterota bacterium]|jgi:glycerol-3-phosphate acyltransferase PlsY|nr:glycerol-3-phosphate 1-O-acyltransferase PlsY [Candidatus Atribacteria bacterium]MDD3538613.1 glycerol-3-phosphate 1-O-acyltransferase PlsY [Atribacterota bacterium]MDD5496901.1 glycerol-3-phosphate 1-O-acyltransferase PlsY [Atribacterota bacterium]